MEYMITYNIWLDVWQDYGWIIVNGRNSDCVWVPGVWSEDCKECEMMAVTQESEDTTVTQDGLDIVVILHSEVTVMTHDSNVSIVIHKSEVTAVTQEI